MAAVRDRLEVLQLQWVHPPALQHLPCNVERDLNGLLSLSALPILMAFHDSRLSRCNNRTAHGATVTIKCCVVHCSWPTFACLARIIT